MAIPDFNEFGLLPTGIHLTDAMEIEARYCGNPNRATIWGHFLDCYRTELRPLGWSNIVWVDGGFTSDKPHTKDIDVVMDVSRLDDSSLFQAVLWHGTNHDRLEQTYHTDFWLYHPKLPSDLRSFFAYIKEQERLARRAPLGTTKGLLRLEL